MSDLKHAVVYFPLGTVLEFETEFHLLCKFKIGEFPVNRLDVKTVVCEKYVDSQIDPKFGRELVLFWFRCRRGKLNEKEM